MGEASSNVLLPAISGDLTVCTLEVEGGERGQLGVWRSVAALLNEAVQYEQDDSSVCSARKDVAMGA